jgi:DNA-binding SARP family transcriptional activator
VAGIEFRVLGPVGVWCDSRQPHPTTAQQRTILAVLLLTPAKVVSLGQLLFALWGDDPPASARNAVRGTCPGCAGCCAACRVSSW